MENRHIGLSEHNYMNDISMEEMVNGTGCSLPRLNDFKMQHTSPMGMADSAAPEAARELIRKGGQWKSVLK